MYFFFDYPCTNYRIVNETQISLKQIDSEDENEKVSIIMETSEYMISKIEEYLDKCYHRNKNNHNADMNELNKYITLLSNGLSIWKFCHLFWFMNESGNGIDYLNIKFVLSYQLWLSQTFKISDIINKHMKNVESGSDEYWHLIKRLVLIGDFENAFRYLKYDTSLNQNSHRLEEIREIFEEAPFVVYAYKGTIFEQHNFRSWNEKVNHFSSRIRDDYPHLYVITRIMYGDLDIMYNFCQRENLWLEWLNGYLMYKNPWVDTRVELAEILRRKQFPQQDV